MLSYNCCYSAALFLYIAIIKSSPATITMTLFIKGNILFCQKSMLTVIRGLNRYGLTESTPIKLAARGTMNRIWLIAIAINVFSDRMEIENRINMINIEPTSRRKYRRAKYWLIVILRDNEEKCSRLCIGALIPATPYILNIPIRSTKKLAKQMTRVKIIQTMVRLI